MVKILNTCRLFKKKKKNDFWYGLVAINPEKEKSSCDQKYAMYRAWTV